MSGLAIAAVFTGAITLLNSVDAPECWEQPKAKLCRLGDMPVDHPAVDAVCEADGGDWVPISWKGHERLLRVVWKDDWQETYKLCYDPDREHQTRTGCIRDDGYQGEAIITRDASWCPEDTVAHEIAHMYYDDEGDAALDSVMRQERAE